MEVKSAMKKPKLSQEERADRNRASCRAWRQKNPEYRWTWKSKHPEQARERACEYRRIQAAVQRQLLLDAGCAQNPVGRPKKDPADGVAGPRRRRVRGEAYKEYQKAYQKQYKARRLADGWVQAACGMVPPEFAAVLRAAGVRSADELPLEKNVGI